MNSVAVGDALCQLRRERDRLGAIIAMADRVLGFQVEFLLSLCKRLRVSDERVAQLQRSAEKE